MSGPKRAKKIDLAREIAHSVIRDRWRLWPPPEAARDRLSESCMGGKQIDGWRILLHLSSREPLPSDVYVDDPRCLPLRTLVSVSVSRDGECVLVDESDGASWDELLTY